MVTRQQFSFQWKRRCHRSNLEGCRIKADSATAGAGTTLLQLLDDAEGEVQPVPGSKAYHKSEEHTQGYSKNGTQEEAPANQGSSEGDVENKERQYEAIVEA